MIGKLAITVGFAALLSAAPALAQDSSQQPVYKPPASQGSGNGNEQGGAKASGGGQTMSQDTGDQGNGETTKKLKKNTQSDQSGQQTTDQQSTDQGSANTNKKKNQQNTQSDQDTNQQATEGESSTTKKKKNQQNTQSGQDMNQQEATGQESGNTKKKKKEQNAAEQGTGQNGSKQVTTGATGKVATEITAKQKTVIKNTIVSEHVHRVARSKLKVSLNVGVVIPSTIELRPLPATIVKVVPEYEGYLFFVLDDGTIVIVEPGTLQVAYIITA
jgi:Protein of unknown function (DUF1236)